VTEADRTAIDLAQFELLAATRRTSLRMDKARSVPIEVIERLCRVAMWAPNHHKTWPWRFAHFTGDGRARLGSTIADALEADGFVDERKLEKYRVKYNRAPSMLVVGSAAGSTSIETLENRDAVSAGVQNLLLAATAAGLASFWSSGAPVADDAVAALCRWEPDSAVVAVIYLGWPDAELPSPERPLPAITEIDH